MHVKIHYNLDGSRVLDLPDATISQIQELMSGTPAASKKTVVQATTDAMTSAVVKETKKTKQSRRRATNLAWNTDDIDFIARMSIQLGPNAKTPSQTIAKALEGRGNKRTFGTLNAMAYNVYRFLRDGKQAHSLSNKTVKDLAALGYNGGMMQPASDPGLLGTIEDVRRIPVQAA